MEKNVHKLKRYFLFILFLLALSLFRTVVKMVRLILAKKIRINIASLNRYLGSMMGVVERQ